MNVSMIYENVRQDLVALVPTSLINETSCFVFYDNHPRDKLNIEITICTSRGEVKEFYQREPVYSIVIGNCSNPVDIKILRSRNCELFYLIALEDEIIVLSRREKLQIFHRIGNVDSYEIEDAVCRGQACLKIIRKDDAVPLIFDDNFENLGEKAEILSIASSDDTMPIMTHLATKLTEAKYGVKCNEKIYKDMSTLRQLTAFSSYNISKPHSGTPVFQECNEGSDNAVTIKSKTPWVKMCNSKIVLIVELLNKSNFLIEDVYILLHSSPLSTVYTTKLFTHELLPPYWKEKNCNIMNNDQVTAAVLVIDFKELKHNITSRMDLGSVISYKIQGKEVLIHLENVNLSAIDTMGETFDVLSSLEPVNEYNMLALMATTERTDLCLRHIRGENDAYLNLLDLFCKYLNMERLLNTDVIVHRKSPYHVLCGVMVMLQNKISETNRWIISLHTRSPSQVVAFIHYMYDAIPHRIIATTVHQKIIAKCPELSEYNEDTTPTIKPINCTELGTSILGQTATVLEYLDDCMIKMSESKHATVLNKVGSEIDVFAGDVAGFLNFKNNILQEASRGIKSLKEVKPESGDSQGMVTIMD